MIEYSMLPCGDPIPHEVTENREALTKQGVYGKGNSAAFELRDWQVAKGFLKDEKSPTGMANILISTTGDGGKVAGSRIGGRDETRQADLDSIRARAEQLAREAEVHLAVKQLGKSGFTIGEFPGDLG